MSPLGYYDLDGTPLTEDQAFALWRRRLRFIDRGEPDPFRVAHDEVGESSISTVFLPFDHAAFGGPPVLWETMVFGGPMDMHQERYTSREDAEKGHADMVERVRLYAELQLLSDG